MEELLNLSRTVNIRFCEPSYARSGSIAEFWNSLTSLAYCVPAILMYFQVRKYQKIFPVFFPIKALLLYAFCGASWCFLAFGSAIFHATQTGWGEMIDELGMILASSSCCFSLIDMHPLTTSRLGASFYLYFTLFMVLSSVVYVRISSHSFFSVYFILSLLVQVLLVASFPVTVRKFNKQVYFEEAENENIDTTKVEMKHDISLDSFDVSRWLRVGSVLAVTGYAIWHVDQYCVRENWPEPLDYPYELYWYYWSHPLWHFFTAAGAFCFMQAILFARIETYRSPLSRRLKTGSFVMKTTVTKAVLQSFGLSMGKLD